MNFFFQMFIKQMPCHIHSNSYIHMNLIDVIVVGKDGGGGDDGIVRSL